MLRKIAVVLLFALLTQAPAQAAWYTGNDLLARCNAGGEPAMLCAGYVVGIADAFAANDNFCIPASVNLRQLVDVFVRFLEQHPDERHLQGSGLVARALAKAFPC